MDDAPLKVTVNVDNMTWGDLQLLLNIGQDPQQDTQAIIDIFDRFVEGGAKAVPIARTQEVVGAIVAAIGELTNPKN